MHRPPLPPLRVEDRASQTRLLIVDDDPMIRELHALVLNLEGYQVETVADGAEALERLAVQRFDLLITDRQMPNLDGVSMVLALRMAGNRIPVIMVSGSLAKDSLPPHLAKELAAVLPKPAHAWEVVEAVAHALELVPRRESLRHFRSVSCWEP